MVKLRKQLTYTLRPGTTKLNAEIAVGAAGAPTLTSGVNHGFKSVARTGTGALTVNLDEPYLGLVGLNAMVEKSSLVDGYGVQLAGEWVAGVDTVNEEEGVADGYLKLLCRDGDGNATDLISHSLWLELTLKTSEQG